MELRDIVKTMSEINPNLEMVHIGVATKQEIEKYKERVGQFSKQTIYATKRELTKLFGAPHDGGSRRVQYSWFVKDSAGAVFEIYDYYHGEKIFDDEMVQWHIGYCRPYYKSQVNSLWYDLRGNLSILRMKEQL